MTSSNIFLDQPPFFCAGFERPPVFTYAKINMNDFDDF